ncbi:MAG: aspartate--tRNA ligase [bacterium]
MGSSYKNRVWCGAIGSKFVNQKVQIYGWVNKVRDMGGILFIDLRDRTGMVQIVVDKQNFAEFEKISGISSEDVLKVVGYVRQRPKDKINPKIPTGEYEIEVEEITILSESLPLPFSISDDEREVNVDETIRLKYRYLDLRRPKMFKNLYFRHKFIKKIRDFLDENEFLEIETPILSKPTPEGARDFLVPSRLQKGKFYALPQSPQLYKQILMVSGIDRYFQIAKCLRDEDLRADRQPEFTQLDLEMSFITQQDIFQLIEEMIKEVLSETLGIEIKIPFRVMKYSQAIDEYLSDKPDLRFPYPIKRITSQKINLQLVNSLNSEIYYLAVPVVVPRKEIDNLYSNGLKFMYLAKDNENYKGTLAKYLGDISVFEGIIGMNSNYTVFVIYDQPKQELEKIKKILIERKVLIPVESFSFVWVVDFPLFKIEDDGKISPEHHPFTNVLPEDRKNLDEIYEIVMENRYDLKDKGFVEKVLGIRSLAYDLVLNGSEIGSGSIRITDPELQRKVFRIIGLSDTEAEERFGFLLNSFRYGVPPHGGIALGIDRIIAILLSANSIRDVIAFPKTQSGSCLLTSSPSEVSDDQLQELAIQLVPLAQERYTKN